MQIRVAVVSAVPTQIKATVAAYVVQKETVANLDSWHPATHVVTESLSGAVVTQTIVCHGPHKQFSDHAPGKHQGVGEFKFTGNWPCLTTDLTCSAYQVTIVMLSFLMRGRSPNRGL